MKEGVDYILEEETNPGEGEMEFNVRFLTGQFVETIIGFKNLTVQDDPNDSDEYLLAFDYAIKSTPDTDLTEENKGLQTACGDVLYNLMTEAVRVKEEDLPRG